MSSSSSFRVFKTCRPMFAAAKAAESPPPSATNTFPKLPKLNALTKPMKISPELSKFIGAPEISRSETIKRIWEYIKLNNLQLPTDRRQITCDAKLKTLFRGKDTIGMLEISQVSQPSFHQEQLMVDVTTEEVQNYKKEVMGDSRDKGFHSSYGGGGYGHGGVEGYGYNSGGYGYPYGGYPPVAYPPATGYPPHAAYGMHSEGLGAVLGGVAGYGTGLMMPHGGQAHGGYVAHGGGYGGHGYGGHGYGYGGGHQHGKFKHGKFGKHGGFKKWK